MPEYVNKDYYRQLAPDDRSFLNLSAQNIRTVMDRLNAENIMFSATVGYKNTITVSKADRERALAIVNSLSDQNRSTARIIGNVPYKELPPSERKYINTDTETALQVANIIAGDSSMKFSGRISGNSATLTVVGEKNAATVRRIIDNIQNMDLVNELREKGYERIADTNGFVNIRNMQTGETAGFESLREARNMFLDPDNEFFHPTAIRIEENSFFRIVSDEENMDYYISEYDPETNEERAVYLDDEGRCPTFSSVDEALDYAAAHSIDYTNTENQLEHWRADDEERAADRERYENNIIIQTKFPHVDNLYPNDIIYNPDSKAFSWVYFNEEGDGGDGEFIDITVTEDDVLAAYNSENFLEYIYQNCKQNIIDTHSGYFEDYANSYINLNNDVVRRYQELTIQAYLEEHTPAVQKAKKSLEGEISTDSDSLIIDGYEGTWYVVDTETVDGKELFLLENENYGDETFGIIIDKDRNVLVDEAWNGFADYHEKYDNLTPEEKLANKVTAEWKAFLEGNGKLWRADKKSLNRGKAISDRIALSHGLSIIEHPKKSYNHKYGDYLSQKRGASWKENLKAELDELVMREDVRSIDDLVEKLKEKGYGIRMKKYLSIQVKPNRKPIRTYRLGDGYFLEHLAYRIEHKNFEMPLSEVAKYDGIQREYAICLRQIQIMLYKAPEPDRPHYVSYRTVLKNYELLCYLHNNNIHSVGELKSVVDKAEGKYSEVLTAKKKLEDRISEEEKILGDFPRFTELVNKNPMTKAEREELKKLSYLADKGVLSVDDVTEHKAILEKLKGQVEGCDENIKAAKAERDKLTDYYDTYTQQVQSDYDFLLERAREEHERKAQAVQINEEHEQERKNYHYEK